MSYRMIAIVVSLLSAAALHASDPVGGRVHATTLQLPAAAAALQSLGNTTVPAWQAPGFVMEEVISIGHWPMVGEPEGVNVTPDLMQLLELHRNALRERY